MSTERTKNLFEDTYTVAVQIFFIIIQKKDQRPNYTLLSQDDLVILWSLNSIAELAVDMET